MDINEILLKPIVKMIVLEINWLQVLVFGKKFRNKQKKTREDNI